MRHGQATGARRVLITVSLMGRIIGCRPPMVSVVTLARQERAPFSAAALGSGAPV